MVTSDTPGNTRPCPYYLCQARVKFLPHGTDSQPGKKFIIQRHEIDHPILRGQCVASLMYLPLNEETLARFEEREHEDSRLIHGEVRRSKPPSGGDAGESTTLRNPGRMGREPSKQSPDWALGGRADEDVQVQPTGKERIPMGVLGKVVGRPVTGIDGPIGALTQAALKGGEGIAALQALKDGLAVVQGSLIEARDLVAAAQGTASAVLLEEYQGMLNQAFDRALEILPTIEESITIINAAQEKGEEYIGRLMGG